MKPLGILVVPSVLLLCLEAAPTSLNITNFVFGGTPARLGQFPMQVYINFQGKSDGHNYHCGGTLLSTTHVLTAAHCAEDMGSMKRIMVGAINRRNPAAGAQWRNVVEIFMNPEFFYDKYGVHNDIAVVKLESPVSLNDNVKVAKIVENDEQLLQSKTATVAGYGTYGCE
uniref:Peptidase S1 domain-containing protein n=1 Tax=Steinernema glaseri TaxID=37863 RepID=A0A1I7ZBX6_9BILA